MATEPAASTTSEVINHVIDKASEGLAAISAAISEHGPQAWTLAVHGVYARGIAQLIVAAGCFIFFLVFLGTSIFFGWRCTETKDADVGVPLVIVCIVAGAISIIMFFAASMNGLDSDAWARVISPDGYLAQSILTSIVSSK